MTFVVINQESCICMFCFTPGEENGFHARLCSNYRTMNGCNLAFMNGSNLVFNLLDQFSDQQCTMV